MREGVLGALRRAQRQRPDAAQDEERRERAGRLAERVRLLADRVEQALRARDHARDGVAVPGQVLRRGVEDEVRAVLDRPQERRAEERVVGDDDEPVPVADARRARRCPASAAAGSSTSRRTGSSSRSVIAASTAARSVMSTGVTSIPRRGRSSSHSTLVIDEQLVAHHEVVALVEVREQRRRHGRHPRRRDDAVLRALERRDLLLERAVRRVARPGVEVRGRDPTRARRRRPPPCPRPCRTRTSPSRRSASRARAWSGRVARPRGSRASRTPLRASVRACATSCSWRWCPRRPV